MIALLSFFGYVLKHIITGKFATLMSVHICIIKNLDNGMGIGSLSFGVDCVHSGLDELGQSLVASAYVQMTVTTIGRSWIVPVWVRSIQVCLLSDQSITSGQFPIILR